ncbi:hypothetical protein BDV10DRAFT_108244 [Aspergillus recurvatus]
MASTGWAIWCPLSITRLLSATALRRTVPLLTTRWFPMPARPHLPAGRLPGELLQQTYKLELRYCCVRPLDWNQRARTHPASVLMMAS